MLCRLFHRLFRGLFRRGLTVGSQQNPECAWIEIGAVTQFAALMTDRYPSTDEEQSVHLDVEYPDVERDLNRWMPLVKWFLAIPHIVALVFLSIGAVFAAIGAWFAILFTGRYPRALFDYVEGVLRWWLRVEAYAVLLNTDEYPPFRLSA